MVWHWPPLRNTCGRPNSASSWPHCWRSCGVCTTGELKWRSVARAARQLRARADYAQGYGPANVLALLREQRGHLRGLDLSHLAIRGASLQGVEMQDAKLAGATAA